MLLKSTKMQLSVMFHKKGFQISFLIVLGYVIVTYLYYVFKLWGYDVSDMYHPAVLSALNSDSRYSWFFMMYYPFIVVLPAGFLFMTDREVNICSIVQARQNIKSYYLSKVIAAFIGGFTVFFIPFIIGLVLNILTFPIEATGTLTNFEIYSDTYYMYASSYLFPNLYHSNIYVYYVITILFFGCFSGIVSVFLIAISTFKIRYRIFMFLPFYLIVYLLRQMKGLFTNSSLEFNYEWYLLGSDAVPNKKIILLIIIVAFLIICSTVIMIKNIKRDQLL
jgi:hypothetical protein